MGIFGALVIPILVFLQTRQSDRTYGTLVLFLRNNAINYLRGKFKQDNRELELLSNRGLKYEPVNHFESGTLQKCGKFFSKYKQQLSRTKCGWIIMLSYTVARTWIWK